MEAASWSLDHLWVILFFSWRKACICSPVVQSCGIHKVQQPSFISSFFLSMPGLGSISAGIIPSLSLPDSLWGCGLNFPFISILTLSNGECFSHTLGVFFRICSSHFLMQTLFFGKGDFKKNLIYFNWRIITLQYCDGFCHISTRISHRYTCVSSILNPSPTSLPTKSLWDVPEHRFWVFCFMHRTHTGYLFYIW